MTRVLNLFWQLLKKFGITAKKPFPVSLATTSRISVDFYSFGYLDVSVHQVFHFQRFPFRISMDHRMFRFSPWRFVTFYVPFLSIPRHPFNAFSLFYKKDFFDISISDRNYKYFLYLFIYLSYSNISIW